MATLLLDSSCHTPRCTWSVTHFSKGWQLDKIKCKQNNSNTWGRPLPCLEVHISQISLFHPTKECYACTTMFHSVSCSNSLNLCFTACLLLFHASKVLLSFITQLLQSEQRKHSTSEFDRMMDHIISLSISALWLRGSQSLVFSVNICFHSFCGYDDMMPKAAHHHTIY